MGRLFGTDGVRGVANTELTAETAMAIGRAAAMVLIDSEKPRPKVIIGKDTRQSCNMLEAAMAAGLCSVGADVTLLGVVPTPAVAYLVKKYRADAGVMISASHNPCEYNGIKIFNGEGYKLSDELEGEIESIVLDGSRTPPAPVGGGVGRIYQCGTAVDDYVRYLVSAADVSLSGMKIDRLRQRLGERDCTQAVHLAGRGMRDNKRPAGRRQHKRRMRFYTYRKAGRTGQEKEAVRRGGVRRGRRPLPCG